MTAQQPNWRNVDLRNYEPLKALQPREQRAVGVAILGVTTWVHSLVKPAQMRIRQIPGEHFNLAAFEGVLNQLGISIEEGIKGRGSDIITFQPKPVEGIEEAARKFLLDEIDQSEEATGRRHTGLRDLREFLSRPNVGFLDFDPFQGMANRRRV